MLLVFIVISRSNAFLHREASLSFNSYADERSILSNPGDKKILVLSLADGTIMALDTASGTVLWSIDQKTFEFFNFMSYCEHNCSTFFIPSTNGDLYYFYDKRINLIKPDDFGHTFLDQQYYFQTSSVKVISMGINIITGKPYFYISEDLCYRTSNEHLKQSDHENLLFIKQTTKVVQLFNVVTKKMVVKFHHGIHQLSAHKYVDEDSERGDFGGLSYDVDTTSLYGWGIDNQHNFVNCWKISLGSHILNAWKVVKTSTESYVSPVSLMNIMTTTSFNYYKLSLRLAYISSSTKESEKCHELYMFHTFKNAVYLQKIGQTRTNSPCKTSQVIDPRYILSNELLKRFSKLTKSEYDFGRNKLLLDMLSFEKMGETNDISEPKEMSRKWSLVRAIIDFIYTLKISEIFSKTRRNLSNIKFYDFFFRKEILVLTTLTVVVVSMYAFKYIRVLLFSRNGNNDPNITSSSDSLVHPTPVDLEGRSENKPEQSDSAKSDFPSTLFQRYSIEFEQMDSIGSGGYGVVFKSRNRMDNFVYAIKRVNLVDCYVARRKTMREVKALAHLNHPNIIRFHAAWFEAASKETIRDTNEDDSENGSENLEKLPVKKGPKQIPLDNTSEDSCVVFEYSDEEHKNRPLLWADFDPQQATDADDSSDSRSRSRSGSETSENTTPSYVRTCHNALCRHSISIYLFIQMELCHKETLKSYLLKTQVRHTPTVISIFSQILSAVNYIHSRSLMHRDIKPSNIFFSFEGKVKLGDFGLVTNFNFDRALDQSNGDAIHQNYDYEDTMTKIVGTELYMAPELLNNCNYDYKVDVYSLGMVLFELVVPFYTQCERSIVVMKLRENLTFPSGCKDLSSDIIGVIRKMMSNDPNERPSISVLLKMPDTRKILRSAASPDISSRNILSSLRVMSTMHQYSDASY